MATEKNRDPELNKFQKTNLYYEDDRYLMFQDPTVLGFKILFDWQNSPLLNPLPDSGIVPAQERGGDTSDGGESSEVDPNTAEGFLQRINDKTRLAYLRQFKWHLQQINERVPWYFQSIEGLDEAWGRNFDEGPKLQDRSLTINCLESVDLKMSSLIDLYRKACFDWRYRREIVPENLRQFSMKVFVLETRRFNFDFLKNSRSTLGTYFSDRSLDNLVKHMRINRNFFGYSQGDERNASGETYEDLGKINRFMFDFSFCEINTQESGQEGFANISNAESEQAAQNMVINYSQVEEENIYRLFSGGNGMMVSDALQGTLDLSALDIPAVEQPDSFSYGDKETGDNLYEPDENKTGEIENGPEIPDNPFQSLQQRVRNKAEQIANATSNFNISDLYQQAAAEALQEISGEVGEALLGNIYGISPLAAAEAAAGGGIGQATSSATSGAGASTRNITGDPSGNTGGGSSTSNGSEEASGTVYGGSGGDGSDDDPRKSVY